MTPLLSSAADSIRSVFDDKLLVDDRDPFYTFDVPAEGGGFVGRLFETLLPRSRNGTTAADGDDDDDGVEDATIRYGVYAPKAAFWNQLTVLVLVQVLFQCLFAAIIYRYIVKRRGTLFSFLLGYLVVIPTAVVLIPFGIVEFFDLRSPCVRLATSNMGTMVFFRVSEAMYGTGQPVVETSLSSYVAYYTTLLQFEWDDKTTERRRITPREFVGKILATSGNFIVLSFVLSVLRQHDYRPFGGPEVDVTAFHMFEDPAMSNWKDLFSPRHMMNTYCTGILLYMTLCTGFELVSLNENIKGYYTKPVFDRPLTTSTSVTDFWGRKWNLMIHPLLKRGVYLPAKKRFGLGFNAAVFLTFLFSGLLHEYAWDHMFYHPSSCRGDGAGDGDYCPDEHVHTRGKVTAFFLWCGFVMTLEHVFVRSYLRMLRERKDRGGGGNISRWIGRVPTPILSTCIVATALPFGHWYAGDWVTPNGYYAGFSQAVYQIRPVANS